MAEVRAHSLRDIRAMYDVIDEERRDRDRAERRRRAHAESLRMGKPL